MNAVSPDVIKKLEEGEIPPASIDYISLLEPKNAEALAALQLWISKVYLDGPPGLPRPAISLDKPLSCELTRPELMAAGLLEAARMSGTHAAYDAALNEAEWAKTNVLPELLAKWRARAENDAPTPDARALATIAATDRFWRWVFSSSDANDESNPLRTLSVSEAAHRILIHHSAIQMCLTDDEHASLLEDVLNRRGWPGISAHGVTADTDAWLIAQHADHRPDLQERVLHTLEELVGKEETDPKNYAYLLDRVAINAGRPQRFGTQLGPKNGCLALRPVEDEAGVDARRAGVGLPPLNEYLSKFPSLCSDDDATPSQVDLGGMSAIQLTAEGFFLEGAEMAAAQVSDDPFSQDEAAQIFSIVGRMDLSQRYHRDNRGALCAVDPEGASARPAAEAILDHVGDTQIVVLNEAHDRPLHRAFGATLLQALYDRGFRYFAAETFYPDVTRLDPAIGPTKKHGFYLLEPMFGDFVRDAARIGYELVPYEYIPESDRVPDADSFQAREKGQAQNLKERIFDKHPDVKVFIFVGYGHAQEIVREQADGSHEGVMMAGHLKIMTGHNPLTIDQTTCVATCPGERHAGANGVIFFDAEDAPIVRATEGYDLQIVHRRFELNRNREAWLFDSNRIPTEIPASIRNLAGSMIVEARPIGSSAKTIASDRIYLRSGESLPLMLPPGEFELRAFGKHRRLLGDLHIRVDSEVD